MLLGMFDSGAGGLTVVAALRQLGITTDITYVADTLAAPYGSRSPEMIRTRSAGIARALQAQGAGRLAIACNTASCLAAGDIATLLPTHDTIAPTVQAAIAAAAGGRIGVLATSATARSGIYQQAFAAAGAQAVVLASPLLATLAEHELHNKMLMEGICAEYIEPLLQQRCTTIVLGCTHYPLLLPYIEAVVGGRAHIISSSLALAQALAPQLQAHPGSSILQCSCTGDADTLQRILPRLGLQAQQLDAWVHIEVPVHTPQHAAQA